MNIVKPPLGVAPYWLVYEERMKNLSDAISRCLEHAALNHAIAPQAILYTQIAKWCEELKMLALLAATLDEVSE